MARADKSHVMNMPPRKNARTTTGRVAQPLAAIAAATALVMAAVIVSLTGVAAAVPAAPAKPTRAARSVAPRASGVAPPVAYGTPRTLLSGPSAPEAVAVDSAGDVFVADTGSGQVVEITPDGTKTVLPFSSLAAPNLVGQAGFIDGLAVDGAGDVFVADTGHNQVLELPKGGSQVVLPFSGLDFPGGIAVDASGDVFVVDTYHSQVLELPKGGAQTTVPFVGLGHPSDVSFDEVGAVSVDGAGDLFVADTDNSRVLELTKGGAQIALPVTSGPNGLAVDSSGQVFVTGSFGVAQLVAGGSQTPLTFPDANDARGVAVDTAGDVFVTEPDANQVEKLTPGGTAVEYPPNALASPTGVAVDGAGDVYVTDAMRDQLVELPSAGGMPLVVALSGLDGLSGVAVDGAGDVFAVDSGNNRVLKIPKGGAQVVLPFHGLSGPNGIAVDRGGNVFVTEGSGVVELTAAGTQRTVPFTGLSDPVAVAVDESDDVIVADAGGPNDLEDEPCSDPSAPCQVVELSPSNTQTTLPLSFMSFNPGLAVDHAGDVFLGGRSVVDLPKGGSAQAVTSVPATTADATGLAVDSAGDVFVVDPTLNIVQEVPVDQALFQNPVNGQLNVDTTQPFAWSTIPAAQGYDLIVGTTLYGNDLVNSGVLLPSQSSFPVPVLPSGRLLYATLFTEEGGTWTRYQVVGFTAAPRSAAFTNPRNGEANIDTTQPFRWTADSAGQAYILVVGTTKFGTNLVSSGPLPATQTSFAVPALPGGLLYATLLTKVNGAYTRYTTSTFTAASGGAMFTSPTEGQLNFDTSDPFMWSTVAQAQGYQLIVGTTVYGHDLVNSAVLPPTTSSYTVPSALPSGKILYATIYTEIGGAWVNYNLVGFTAEPAG